jgi:hypothetical protein
MKGTIDQGIADPQNNPGARARENSPGARARDHNFHWSGIKIDDFVPHPGYGDPLTDDPEMDQLDRDQCLTNLTSAGILS